MSTRNYTQYNPLVDLAPPPARYFPCTPPEHLDRANWHDHDSFSKDGHKFYWLLFFGTGEGLYSYKGQAGGNLGHHRAEDAMQRFSKYKGDDGVLPEWKKHCFHHHPHCNGHPDACDRTSCHDHEDYAVEDVAQEAVDAAVTAAEAARVASVLAKRTLHAVTAAGRAATPASASRAATSPYASPTPFPVPVLHSSATRRKFLPPGASAHVRIKRDAALPTVKLEDSSAPVKLEREVTLPLSEHEVTVSLYASDSEEDEAPQRRVPVRAATVKRPPPPSPPRRNVRARSTQEQGKDRTVPLYASDASSGSECEGVSSSLLLPPYSRLSGSLSPPPSSISTTTSLAGSIPSVGTAARSPSNTRGTAVRTPAHIATPHGPSSAVGTALRTVAHTAALRCPLNAAGTTLLHTRTPTQTAAPRAPLKAVCMAPHTPTHTTAPRSPPNAAGATAPRTPSALRTPSNAVGTAPRTPVHAAAAPPRHPPSSPVYYVSACDGLLFEKEQDAHLDAGALSARMYVNVQAAADFAAQRCRPTDGEEVAQCFISMRNGAIFQSPNLAAKHAGAKGVRVLDATARRTAQYIGELKFSKEQELEDFKFMS
ncbi:hypothetical protein B0H17DRAFT_1214843 [Mycena rosella]|uniref:Uncharacterized protein n=1 Tax=Mycena rosella TaxID=1033263 RepID=A0AAD7CPH9_MYCRO|nr:hypothetical protein B0H17DRAFT_1214843 [Mycena rosella]